MASEFLGLNRGASEMQPDLVVAGTSTGATDVELRVDLTKGLTRKDIVTLTEAILRFVEDGRDPNFAL